MEHTKLNRLADKWSRMTHEVLELKDISATRLHDLLKETYGALALYYKEKSVPKEICKILLEMEDFLYFAFLMEEKEGKGDYDCYRRVSAIVKGLERGFFCGDFGCDFPRLRIFDDNQNPVIFDFDKPGV